MRYFSTRLGLLGVFFLAALPVFADTAAGLTAFKNKDYQRAYREWNAAADAGQAEAQFDLAFCTPRVSACAATSRKRRAGIANPPSRATPRPSLR